MSTLRTWLSTVRSVSTSLRAIALFVRPSAINERTSRSRPVRSPKPSASPPTSDATTCGSRADPPRATRSAASRKLRHVQHPVLEQVAEPAPGDEPDRPGRLNVLREHEHPHAGVGVPNPPSRADSLVLERRGHSNVDHREIGLVLADRGPKAVGVLRSRHHLVPGVFEKPAEALSQQDLVLGDHDSHGSSATTTVPPPAGLSTVRVPPRAATRSVMPARPEPTDGWAPPNAVVADGDDQIAIPRGCAQGHGRGAGVLRRVGERLARNEVGGGLERVPKALVRDLDPGPQR
jgi:hypothetical protein